MYRWQAFRRLICLVFVCFICIENFAAIVLDDDKSTFVTKAEFEAYTEDFKEQINSYNNNLERKIDGAIATYLTNLHLGNPVVYNVINKKWDEVIFINGVYNNDYKTPDIDYLVGLNDRGSRVSSGKAIDIRAFDSNFYMNYKRPSGESNRKNCFLVLEGTEGAPTKIYWRGIAKSYREKIFHSLQNGNSSGALGGFCWPDSDYVKRVLCNYALRCKNPSYAITYNSEIFDFTMDPQLKEASGGSWRSAGTLTSSWKVPITRFDIELDTIDGKQYDTEHIVGWASNTQWELYCPNWKNTWQQSSHQTINDKTMYESISVVSNGWYAGEENSGGTYRNASGAIPYTFVNSSTATGNMFYSIGLYATLVSNNQIYQNKGNIPYTSSETFEVPNLTLEKGLAIMAGKEDDIVTYEPVIPIVKCYNESGEYVTNANEVDIYLSYVPFTEKNISTDPIGIKQSDGTTKNYITTSDRKAKIDFVMNKNSLVYMQMKPHFDSTETVGPSKSWEISLDLSGDGGTYTSISPTS